MRQIIYVPLNRFYFHEHIKDQFGNALAGANGTEKVFTQSYYRLVNPPNQILLGTFTTGPNGEFNDQSGQIFYGSGGYISLIQLIIVGKRAAKWNTLIDYTGNTAGTGFHANFYNIK